MPRAAVWFALAAAVLIADRLSKLVMLDALVPGQRLEVTGFFNLVLVFNRGAAFSFLADAAGWQTLLFAAIAIGAALVVSWLILRTPERREGRYVPFEAFHYLGVGAPDLVLVRQLLGLP